MSASTKKKKVAATSEVSTAFWTVDYMGNVILKSGSNKYEHGGQIKSAVYKRSEDDNTDTFTLMMHDGTTATYSAANCKPSQAWNKGISVMTAFTDLVASADKMEKQDKLDGHAQKYSARRRGGT